MVDFNLGDYLPQYVDNVVSYFLTDPLATKSLIVLVRNARRIPFDLEIETDELTEREVDELADGLRRRVSRDYPGLKLSEDLVVSGRYGGADRGPAIQGEADVGTFREVFGNGVQLGVSCLLGRFIFPTQMCPQWYQVGKLRVPRNLRDFAKGVYITKPDSVHEIRLWVPAQAQKYSVVNELRRL